VSLDTAWQVLWSYGTRSNDDFFVYHGFALPDNPDDDVVLFDDVQQLAAWAQAHLTDLQQLQLGSGQLASIAGSSSSRG